MQKKFADEIRGHRLRREIIATVIANDLIDRGGPSFVTRLQDATGQGAREVVRAFTVVRDGFGLPALYREIDALDNQIDGQVQLDLYATVGRMAQAATAWDLKNGSATASLGEQIAELQAARATLEPKLRSMLPDFTLERIEERRHALFKGGAPEKLAERLALIDASALISDIALVAKTAKADLVEAAKAFFAVSDAFRIGRIESAARSITPTDYYDGLALTRAGDTIAAARRGMAVAALSGRGKSDNPVGDWLEAGGQRIGKVRERLQALTEGSELSVSRLSVAAGLMADLSDHG